MNGNNKIIPVVWWTFSLAIMTVIFIFSSQSGDESSVTSGGFVEMLFKSFYPDFALLSEQNRLSLIQGAECFVRKMAHFSVYTALGFCVTGAVSSTFRSLNALKYSTFSVTFCAIFAASDEWHQTFVAERSGQITDILIDTLGAVFGALAFAVIIIVIKRVKNRTKIRN